MKTILHTVAIAAPAERVRTALSTLDGLASWWTRRVSGDPAPGGVIAFRFHDDFGPDMRVDAVTDERVAWTCVGGHEPWTDNTFTFDVRGSDPVSLRFVQSYARELDDDAYGTYNFNWGYFLESLRLAAETGTGKPYRST